MTKIEKIDLRKSLKELFTASGKSVKTVSVPKLKYLMLDGAGNPTGSESFQHAVEALYALSYTMKMDRKKRGEGPDYSVMPLEGLWWAENMDSFIKGKRKDWLWTLMIMQPEFITQAEFKQALKSVGAKKQNPALDQVRLENLAEGACAQIMHVGPYSTEGPTIKALHDYVINQGGRIRGKHHEIYLGDPRRSAPEKLKTIIRQPLDSRK